MKDVRHIALMNSSVQICVPPIPGSLCALTRFFCTSDIKTHAGMWTACSVSNPILFHPFALYGYLYLFLWPLLNLPESFSSLCFSLNVFILGCYLAARAPWHASGGLIELPLGYWLFVIAIWAAAPRWLQWSLVSGVAQLLNPAVIPSGWGQGQILSQSWPSGWIDE